MGRVRTWGKEEYRQRAGNVRNWQEGVNSARCVGVQRVYNHQSGRGKATGVGNSTTSQGRRGQHKEEQGKAVTRLWECKGQGMARARWGKVGQRHGKL